MAGEVALAQQRDQVVVKIRQSPEMPVGIATVVVRDPHAPAAAQIIGVILATKDTPELEFLAWAFSLMAGASCTGMPKPAMHVAAGRGVVLANGGLAICLEQIAHGLVEGVGMLLRVEARFGQGVGRFDQRVGLLDVGRRVTQGPGARSDSRPGRAGRCRR